jgi:hypothetical protein
VVFLSTPVALITSHARNQKYKTFFSLSFTIG